jgi:putative N6-adenine-specific DNA methylase
LRETLAASIALTARPKEDILFWDPFCGSGTIAIEAAMIATRRAPGLGREFAGQDFACIPEPAWTDAATEAQDLIIRDSKFEAWASDIDEDMLDVTYENATRAGVEEYLNIFHADARKIKREERKGTVVCNPPYGERMMEEDEVRALYRDMGKTFAELYPWHVYIITSYPEFERSFGRVADKTHRLYNGMLPCTLYEYFRDPAEAKKPYFEQRKPAFDKSKPVRKDEQKPYHKEGGKPHFDGKKKFDKDAKKPDFKKK